MACNNHSWNKVWCHWFRTSGVLWSGQSVTHCLKPWTIIACINQYETCLMGDLCWSSVALHKINVNINYLGEIFMFVVLCHLDDIVHCASLTMYNKDYSLCVVMAHRPSMIFFIYFRKNYAIFDDLWSREVKSKECHTGVCKVELFEKHPLIQWLICMQAYIYSVLVASCYYLQCYSVVTWLDLYLHVCIYVWINWYIEWIREYLSNHFCLLLLLWVI